MTISLSKHPANLSIPQLLQRAGTHIAAGENRLRQAAEDLGEAYSQGATQVEMAKALGKSQQWVSRLLAWRHDGYQDDTPFGPQAAAAREVLRSSPVTSKPEPASGELIVDGTPAPTAASPNTSVEATPQQVEAVRKVVAADRERKRLARVAAKAAKAAPASATTPKLPPPSEDDIKAAAAEQAERAAIKRRTKTASSNDDPSKERVVLDKLIDSLMSPRLDWAAVIRDIGSVRFTRFIEGLQTVLAEYNAELAQVSATDGTMPAVEKVSVH